MGRGCGWGAVTHRRRPAIAGGITFLKLEDETGMANVLVSLGLFHRFSRAAQNSAVVVRLGHHILVVLRGIEALAEAGVGHDVLNDAADVAIDTLTSVGGS